MRHRLYYHLVWTTRAREPLLTVPIATFLCRYLRHVAIDERARILELGMVQTHVHALLTTHPLTQLSRLIQRLKGGSARVAFNDGIGSIRWAAGYALETVTPGDVDRVRRYLQHQPTHHLDEAIPFWTGDLGSAEIIRLQRP